MPRHKKPQILIDYENRERPKICHTCEHYDITGLCFIHRQSPPEDFAKKPNSCQDYEEGVPF